MTITVDLQAVIDDWAASTSALSLEAPAKAVTLKDDPVVLACAAYRTWQEHPAQRWADFDTVVVWEDDREKAEQLKAYYRERFLQTTFDMLKSTNNRGLTSFRRKLYLLANNELPITDKEIGLLHRLPYFYAEDLALDEIASSTKSVSEHIPAHKQTLKLTLLKKVLRSRSSGESTQYWFTEESNRCAYMLSIKSDNVLANFFDSLTNRPLNVESVVVCKQMQGRSDHVYFHLAGPRAI